MVSSPADSRVIPNHPRTVQGAQIFDIQPVDSRAVPVLTPSFSITSVANASGAPVDSRLAGNIPQNSCT